MLTTINAHAAGVCDHLTQVNEGEPPLGESKLGRLPLVRTAACLIRYGLLFSLSLAVHPLGGGIFLALRSLSGEVE